MKPFDAYKHYVALKLHFDSDSYDYIKYQGKTRASRTNFETRRDRYFFVKLSKHKDLINFLVSNFIDNDHKWVGTLTNEEAEKTYTDWLRRIQSLSYNFKNEIENIELEDMKVENGGYPKLLSMYNHGDVSIEVMVILNDLLNIFDVWDKRIDDTFVYPDIKKKIVKYAPFLKYDKKKFAKLLKNRYK